VHVKGPPKACFPKLQAWPSRHPEFSDRILAKMEPFRAQFLNPYHLLSLLNLAIWEVSGDIMAEAEECARCLLGADGKFFSSISFLALVRDGLSKELAKAGSSLSKAAQARDRWEAQVLRALRLNPDLKLLTTIHIDFHTHILKFIVDVAGLQKYVQKSFDETLQDETARVTNLDMSEAELRQHRSNMASRIAAARPGGRSAYNAMRSTPTGEIHTDPKQIVATALDFWGARFAHKPIDEGAMAAVLDVVDYVWPQISPPCIDTLAATLKRTGNSSCGVDGICFEILRNGDEAALPVLHEVSRALRDGEAPDPPPPCLCGREARSPR
jgi:hypothetical protein